MSLKLKVKICSLAAESQIIRRQQNRLIHRAAKYPEYHSSAWSTPQGISEEFKVKAREMRLERKRAKARVAIIKMGQKPKNIWPELQMHRRWDVRREARAALLAYAFLRGVPYKSVEAKFHDGNAPDWAKVQRNVERFTLESDMRIVLQRFAEWKDAHGKEDQGRNESGEQTTQAA